VRAIDLRVTVSEVAGRRLRRTGWTLLVVVIALGSLWSLSGQRDSARLVGLPEPGLGWTGLALLCTVAVLALVLLAARGLRALVRRGSRAAGRFGLPPVVATPLTALLIAGLVFVLLDVLVYRGAMDRVTASAGLLNADTPDGRHRPASALRSGSPASAEPWDTLGRNGQAFVADGPTAADIAAATGAPAVEPIRVYAGLSRGRSVEEVADAVVAELRRTGAFDRGTLALMTTTGRGWVDEWSASFDRVPHRRRLRDRRDAVLVPAQPGRARHRPPDARPRRPGAADPRRGRDRPPAGGSAAPAGARRRVPRRFRRPGRIRGRRGHARPRRRRGLGRHPRVHARVARAHRPAAGRLAGDRAGRRQRIPRAVRDAARRAERRRLRPPVRAVGVPAGRVRPARLRPHPALDDVPAARRAGLDPRAARLGRRRDAAGRRSSCSGSSPPTSSPPTRHRPATATATSRSWSRPGPPSSDASPDLDLTRIEQSIRRHYRPV
jgi:hypothetical protein